MTHPLRSLAPPGRSPRRTGWRAGLLAAACAAASLAAGRWGEAPQAAGDDARPTALVSGRQPGEKVSQFYVRAVTGPLAHKSVCYVCRNGDRPVVMVFFRRTSPRLQKLLAGVDKLVDGHRAAGLRSFGVLVTDEAKDAVAQLQTLAFDGRLALPLAVGSRQLEVENAQNLAAEAEITVVCYRECKVVSSLAFRANELDDDGIARVLSAARGLVAAETGGGADVEKSSREDSMNDDTPARTFRLVIHGGARSAPREELTPERDRAYREAMQKALRAGHAILERGGTSLDAVQAAIVVLEDEPLYNAGKGAVYTSTQTHELDASIMDGRNLSAGAVAGVKRVKNPIKLARVVMEKSPHVMLIGEGAEFYAVKNGLELVPNEYFSTPEKLEELRRVQEAEKKAAEAPASDKQGTVGAVALDRHGNLAAGTSTGGITNKRFGRIGDSPVIGAGTYANNATCAVSCTGHGEFFIRRCAAYDVSALMEYKGLGLQEACDAVVKAKLLPMGGRGALIAVDREGNVAASWNTAGVFRGQIGPDGVPRTAIFADDER